MEVVPRRDHATEMIYSITSAVERSLALGYLTERLSGFELYDYVEPPIATNGSCELYFVGSPGKPENYLYDYGWGGSAAESLKWLVSETVSYLLANDTHLCLIQDICRRRCDPGIQRRAPGPHWFHGDKVFWPISQEIARNDLIETALKWGAIGRPQLIVFCRRPKSKAYNSGDEISETALEEIGSSTVRVVTDVFDQEAYLVWNRTSQLQE